MQKSSNTITWIGRSTNKAVTAEVTRVVLFHSKSERQIGRITIALDYGPRRYRIALTRQEGNQFQGTCEKFEHVSERLVDKAAVSCSLFDSLQAHALLLGGSAWVDDSGEESDWMGKFEAVQRVIHSEEE